MILIFFWPRKTRCAYQYKGSKTSRFALTRSDAVMHPPIPGNARNAAEIHGFCAAVPEVRIHLSPAESQVRTCLSREFAFLRREAAVFRGLCGLGWRRGRRRRAGWSN